MGRWLEGEVHITRTSLGFPVRTANCSADEYLTGDDSLPVCVILMAMTGMINDISQIMDRKLCPKVSVIRKVYCTTSILTQHVHLLNRPTTPLAICLCTDVLAGISGG